MSVTEKFLPADLSDQDCANIANSLQIPVITAQIINREAPWDSATRYAINELLSDMQPDAALLSLAFSALGLAHSHAPASAAMGALAVECSRVLSEYGPLWLSRPDSHSDSREAAETLSLISEDLECFAELLELNIDYLRAKEPVAAEIFEVFLIQTKAHLLIAETFIDVVTYAASAAEEDSLPTPPLASAAQDLKGMKAVIAHRMMAESAQDSASNVILFSNHKKS